mgnify:CR=1 FL=1
MKRSKKKWGCITAMLLSAVVAAVLCIHYVWKYYGLPEWPDSRAYQSAEERAEKSLNCLCPPVISLQPYGNFTQKEAAKLGKELEKLLFEYFNVELECEVLPGLPLSDSLLNDAKTRYRADKIIRSMSPKASKHNIYIGLTHRDISCSTRGRADWGVQGLSILTGKACVASTFRVKNKREFPLVVCHEFIHTYFNYAHCPKDDPHCLMQDAKGHPYLKIKKGLCEYCRSVLKI